MRALLLFTLAFSSTGCLYKAGSGLMAGVLDESAGKGKSGGVEPIVDGIVERALLAELGNQLGQGLQAGVTEITPEQRASLEATVDGLVTLAMIRAGEGLRREVSPELRALVKRDIVETFAEGVRGELGPTLEQTVDKIVTKAVISLRTNLADEENKYVTADLLRDSIYLAMREGYASPPIGETIEDTLQESVLDPFSNNVGDLAGMIALQVDAQAQRGERTLRAVIGALILLIGVGLVVYTTQRRKIRRQKRIAARARRNDPVPSPTATLDGRVRALDPTDRAALEAKMAEILALLDTPKDP